MDKEYVVGVDVGGQTTKIGIVDRRGEIPAQTVISSKFGPDEGEKFMDSVCETIKSWPPTSEWTRSRVSASARPTATTTQE